MEESFSHININQWQNLSKAITQEEVELAGEGWPFMTVDLERLELKDCSPYEWVFQDNRFNTALCPPDTSIHDPLYFEEWFSAWDIQVGLADADEKPESALKEEECEENSMSGRNVGRPIAAWWPDFVAELVAYIGEVGLPEGIGHQGQSEVIKDVCSRLQERGKIEPSRSQVQEAVNAVLRRMRVAGN